MFTTDCGCGQKGPWLTLEGRTDDLTCFEAEDKTIQIAPLSLYAVLKEVKEIRRFQLLAYPHNQIALRIEPKEGTSKQQAFQVANQVLIEYLTTQGIQEVRNTLDDTVPQVLSKSGKFKHIINMQKED